MRILALEFSSSLRSVAAVWRDQPIQPPAALEITQDSVDAKYQDPVQTKELRILGSGAFGASEALETRGPVVRCLALVEEVLRDAHLEREQIECVAVGIGPGSYTGIRAAIALAQGWTLASSARLLAISSVECIAAAAQDQGLRGKVAVIIDAQRNEFYCANFFLNHEGCTETNALRLLSAKAVRDQVASGNLLVGPDLTGKLPEARQVFPRAEMLGRLALLRTDYVLGQKIEPIYLRETGFVKAPPSRPLPSS